MSRQAILQTGLVAKDPDTLKKAYDFTIKELGAVAVQEIAYYHDRVMGIELNGFQAGIIVDAKGNVLIVGEDYHLHSDLGKRLKKIIEKNYKAVAVSKYLQRSQASFTVRNEGRKITFSARR